jgi:hypothetical protein
MKALPEPWTNEGLAETYLRSAGVLARENARQAQEVYARDGSYIAYSLEPAVGGIVNG